MTLYVASVTLRVRPRKRHEVLSAIEQLMHRMRMWPECVVCNSHAVTDDENTFVLISEWVTHGTLDDLLQSDEFVVLRGMHILLEENIEMVVDEIATRTALVLDA